MNAEDLTRAKRIAADLKQMSPDSYMAKSVCILLEMVEDRDGQIATLKAALVKERDRQLGCERLTIEQLARELPEIFKEDTQ